MASDVHQLLVRMMTQMMVHEGFLITNYDGEQSKCIGGGKVPFPLPIKIGRHRPDVIGVNYKRRMLGIGEAKTVDDIENIRSTEQFIDFSSVCSCGDISCILFVAVPSNALITLRKVMVKYNLYGKKNIQIISVPEVLLKMEAKA